MSSLKRDNEYPRRMPLLSRVTEQVRPACVLQLPRTSLYHACLKFVDSYRLSVLLLRFGLQGALARYRHTYTLECILSIVPLDLQYNVDYFSVFLGTTQHSRAKSPVLCYL